MCEREREIRFEIYIYFMIIVLYYGIKTLAIFVNVNEI